MIHMQPGHGTPGATDGIERAALAPLRATATGEALIGQLLRPIDLARLTYR